MKKKVLAILLSVLMLTSVTLPGTWATTGDAETPTAETTVGDVVIEEPAPETATATDAAVTEESATESATDTDTESATNSESEDVTVVIVPESDDESAVDESESETAESEEESESAESEETTESAEESEAEPEGFDPYTAVEYLYELDSDEAVVAYLQSLTEEELAAVQALLEEYGVWDLYADLLYGVSDVVNALLACENTEAMAAELTDEQKAALTDEQKTKLQERYDELHSAQGTALIYDTENLYSPRFTTVGPLVGMEDIWLPENWGVSAIANGDNEGELKLNKTATYENDENNAITITLEAFATGESITTYVKEGVDIVLMLDLSDYMNDSIGDKLTALKNAVKTFIGTVHEEAPSSRIAIVTYGGTASVVTGSGSEKDEALVTVDDTGYTTLIGIVDGLQIVGGSSNSHYAADDAVKIFQDVPTNSAEYNRQRIAVLFSAGIPGTGWATGEEGDKKGEITSGQSVGLATMVQTQILKTAKGVNSSPTKSNFDGGLYWGKDNEAVEKWGTSYGSYSFEYKDEDYYKNVVYTGCGATMYCVGLDIPSSGDALTYYLGDEPYKSGALANEYFWRASSHKMDGSHISSPNDLGTKGVDLWNGMSEIFRNRYSGYTYFYPDYATRDQKDGYYHTTYSTSQSDLDELTRIFNDIAGNASTVVRPSSSLNSSTVIKDIIAPQFQLPEGTEATNITIKTYRYSKYNGNFNNEGSWTENNGDNLGASATVTTDGIVSVTGFDFSNNWCGNANSYTGQQQPHGNKLVISFVVSPKYGFLGGNDVYTNTSAGVYESADATEPVLTFPRPTVNVPIQDVTVTAKDKNVYLLGNLTADQIKSGATVHCGGVKLDLSKANEDKPYGLEPWQTAYVDIDELKIVDDEGNEVGINDYQNLKDDTTYTVSATVKPKTDGVTTNSDYIVKSVTPNDMAGKTGKDEGNIYVFKPELTYQDSVVSLGETVANYAANTVSQKWKHGTDYVVEGTEMIGEVPMLKITYSPAIPTGGKKIDSLDDISVTVATATIDNEDVLEYITFMREACSYESCLWKTKAESSNNPAFVLHVNTFELTIVKIGWQGIDENQSFIFDVKQGNTVIMTVTIKGNGCVKITGLPAGTYTVEENKNWSWRYTPTYSPASVTLGGTTKSGTITATNTREGNNWLDGNAYVENKWPLTENQPVTQAVAYGFGKRYN